MNKDVSNDWRLTNQKKRLYQKKLLHIPYEQPNERLDHEHCAFCWDKIDKSTPIAYATEDKNHWICETCFNDFKEMFEWEVDK